MKKKLQLFKVPQINSIQDMLLQSAEKYAHKLALEDLNQTPISRVTYHQLLENVLRFGNALKTLGIKERAHIAVISENRVQWSIAYLTCLVFNYVVVPIDKNLNTNEILNILHESDAETIIFSSSYNDMLIEQKRALKKIAHYINMDKKNGDDKFLSMVEMINSVELFPADKLPAINPEEMAKIIFTSGSIGRAKGVVLSQKNLASNLMNMTRMINIKSDDKFLSVLPIHHTYECTCGMLCPLYCGSSVHYARSLKTITEDLQKVKATILLAVPLLYDKMYKRIMKSISDDKVKSKIVPLLIKTSNVIGRSGAKRKIFKELHEKFGGNIRLFIAGGAAPDPKVAKGLREFGFNFVQGYGLTETSPILALNRLDNFKDNAAGLPLPNIELKINNPSSDGVGEIYAKGPSVMIGYYKNEKLTNEAFENGWLVTGDLGSFDEDGFLHINGRKKNVIISRTGENVFPEEIEDILNRNPLVLESFVYGEKDAKHDEVISAQIVINAEELINYADKNNVQVTTELAQELMRKAVDEVNKELQIYKRIKKFYIREQEFEKTTTQKIKRYLISKEPVTTKE